VLAFARFHFGAFAMHMLFVQPKFFTRYLSILVAVELSKMLVPLGLSDFSVSIAIHWQHPAAISTMGTSVQNHKRYDSQPRSHDSLQFHLHRLACVSPPRQKHETDVCL
jgi:hypothetical protein